MTSEEDKKKYWCDQIKTMIGPCMITFAIPLMIPGFTITFVAFAEEDAFQKYGALHIVGILILGVAVILLILGCILRFYWKPFISPDIEMHLSPKRIFQPEISNSRHSVSDRHETVRDLTASVARRNSLKEPDRARTDSLHASGNKIEKSESETEGTGSESELKKLTGNLDRTFDIMASPRSRNLVPVNSESLDETENTVDIMASPRSRNLVPENSESLDETDNSLNDYKETETYETLQEYRKKKRRAKKRMKQLNTNETTKPNAENQTDNKNESVKQKVVLQNSDAKKPKRKKKKKKVLNSLKSGHGTLEQNRSEFPCESNISGHVRPEHKHVEHEQISGDNLVMYNENGANDSDHSSLSIGSADSVLAQYTSRSRKDSNGND